MCKILKLSYYRNYCSDSIQILHNDKNHSVLFAAHIYKIADNYPLKKSINCIISGKIYQISKKIWGDD